jgi:hypothetical protein
MKTFLLGAVILGLLSLSVAAEDASPSPPEPEKKQYSRFVPPGVKRKIGFFHSLNPDCTSTGDILARVVKAPQHGTVETPSASDFATYPKDNIRFKCNEHKVRGIQVIYKSDDKYVGDDEFEVLLLFASGNAWNLHYKIGVR